MGDVVGTVDSERVERRQVKHNVWNGTRVQEEERMSLVLNSNRRSE